VRNLARWTRCCCFQQSLSLAMPISSRLSILPVRNGAVTVISARSLASWSAGAHKAPSQSFLGNAKPVRNDCESDRD